MTDNSALLAFESEYDAVAKEILVLTSDSGIGAGRARGEVFWTAAQMFLAYVDAATKELHKGDGRVVWPISEEEQKDSKEWMRRFKKGCIYRLKVRELTDKTVPDGRLPSFYNRFLVVEIMQEDAENKALAHILAEHRKPVFYTDADLGTFELNRQLGLFDGSIQWMGKKTSATLEVNPTSKPSWKKAANVMRTLVQRQKEQDAEFKAFAANKLTPLANEWSEEDAKITEDDFANKIYLRNIVAASSGKYIAYYDDGNMFAGHCITLYGSLKKGISSANIEG